MDLKLEAFVRMKEIMAARDRWNMVVQYDGDGGDSAIRTGLWLSLSALIGLKLPLQYEEYMRGVSADVGLFRRHPDESKWYSNPSNCSRDQAAKITLTAYLYDDKKTAAMWLLRMLGRCLFHQNNRIWNDPIKWKMPDIMSPGEWANLMRFWFGRAGWPVLFFLDVATLLQFYMRSKWDGANLVLIDWLYGCSRASTPAIWLCTRYVKHNLSQLEAELRNNYSPVNNGVANLAELYILVVRKQVQDGCINNDRSY